MPNIRPGPQGFDYLRPSPWPFGTHRQVGETLMSRMPFFVARVGDERLRLRREFPKSRALIQQQKGLQVYRNSRLQPQTDLMPTLNPPHTNSEGLGRCPSYVLSVGCIEAPGFNQALDYVIILKT